MRELVGEHDEGLLAGTQGSVSVGRGALGVAEGQLALQHQRVGAAVDDHEVVGERLEPRRRQAVVEARDELHLHRDLAVGAAGDPDQLVVGVRSVRVLTRLRHAKGEEIRQHERAGWRPEGRLEHVRSRQVAPR